MNTEIFKPIKNYPKYEVSNFGNIYSHKHCKVLKLTTDAQGYDRVRIKNSSGKYCMVKIHRLVAEYFIGDLTGMVVNHIDGNKRNNHHTNLEVITQRENIRHAIKNNFRQTMDQFCRSGKGRQVIITDKDGNRMIVSSLNKAAKKLDVSLSAIYNCCTGRQHRAKGYVVRYA